MLALMLTCRQIREEASYIFFRHNHFAFYNVNKPNLPRGLRLDKYWFTKSPVPIRKMTLGSSWETPKLIANCPDLMRLTLEGEARDLCHDVAVEQSRDAWILQYRTNLARLLSRRNGRIMFEGNGTFFERAEIIGSGDSVDTWEVLELITELKTRCGGVALLSKWKKAHDGEEEECGPWVVRIGFLEGGVVTARLLRRYEDAIMGF